MAFLYYKIKKYKIKIILYFINFYLALLSIEKRYYHNYKIIAISYASWRFIKQLKFNELTAFKFGKVDEYYSYKFNDIDLNFKKKNKHILSRRRGNGYWLWKPYFILKALKEKLNKGDYLIYTDAGILYLDKVDKVIKHMISVNEDIWVNRLTCLEKKYSKRDAFILLDADNPIYTDTYHYMAGIQVYKKSVYTENFLTKLLYYSTDKRIITDDPNTLGFPNYKEFVENRHDQTVLSILIKKFRFSKLNKYKTKASDINKMNNFKPKSFCVYRRLPFRSYYELRNKCKDII